MDNYENIREIIRDSADEGHYNAFIELKSPETVEHLRELGYSVEYCEDGYIIGWLRISECNKELKDKTILPLAIDMRLVSHNTRIDLEEKFYEYVHEKVKNATQKGGNYCVITRKFPFYQTFSDFLEDYLIESFEGGFIIRW